MYVKVDGLGAYRRKRGMGDLNCPGDPGCPGYVAPGSTEYQTTLLQEILANQLQNQAQTQVATATTGQTFSDWVNANSTMLTLGGAGLIVLLAFTRGGR